MGLKSCRPLSARSDVVLDRREFVHARVGVMTLRKQFQITPTSDFGILHFVPQVPVLFYQTGYFFDVFVIGAWVHGLNLVLWYYVVNRTVVPVGTMVLLAAFTISVMEKRLPTKTILAANLRYLMKDREWDQTDLGKKSGVSQKTVSNILNEQKVPGLDTVDKLAGAFGLNLWHLILPGLIEDLQSPTSIREVYEAFRQTSDKGKQFILSVAEREADRDKKIVNGGD